ncbi:MAG: threonine synthase [Phycisphaerae bacterium]|nr:threonine synthase [Phycisphaerae bacterium]
MNYVSTRGQVEPLEFQQAVMMGLADDGGLLIPEHIPDVRDRLDAWGALDYPALAGAVLRLFTTDMPADDLDRLIEASYGETFEPDVAPVVRVGELFVLELWHGPTMSFKDVALQLLGNLFEYILARGGGRMNILGATSGDTGSAAICGARGRDGIDIFMMHPAGRVSPIQARQMTTVLDDNVHNIAVEGSFDDCQRIMKTLAGDLDFKRRYALGAVNSVNWARVLAQIVYYFKAAFDVQRATGAERVRVCVPTGNFGNILAAWYAVQMGAPISRLILATNENDILARFFNTGQYALGSVHETLAPAMDIQVASNFERYLYYKLDGDDRRLQARMAEFSRTGSLMVEPERPGGGPDPLFEAGAATRDDILAAIRRCHDQYGYLIDPHTACGYSVVTSLVPAGVGEAGGPDDTEPTVVVATAHPAKFPDAIREATGADIARHPQIDALADKPTRCVTLDNDIEAVRKFIIDTVG